ncbi:hypothetical protein BX666DRAFT_1892881 [Dichotomocladium elegans]|nr:hypothetical protein BX666DRAFT_1892881 [Dichotomocladium elegans]
MAAEKLSSVCHVAYFLLCLKSFDVLLSALTERAEVNVTLAVFCCCIYMYHLCCLSPFRFDRP